MAQLSTDKSAPKVVERFVRGLPATAINSTPLLSLASKPVLGIFVISFTAAIAALTNTVTVQLQEYTITAAGDEVGVEVGDLFVPFTPAIGSSAGQLNSTVTLVPAVAVTKHKVPVQIVNLTAAATDPNDTLTLNYLWIKTVATSGT